MSAKVFGHKNPDTDSVVSAIAAARLMSKIGVESQPCVQGALTPETEFVLNKFGVSFPDLCTDAKGSKIILVDHSDKGQAPDNLADAEIVAVIDHHKLGDVTTSTPLLMWVWPVGCTCTVIKAMYDFYDVKISADTAGIMLGAILSDTLIFKSPTTTDNDRKAAQELAAIANVADMHAFGMEMFKVKSAVDGVPAKDLLFRDYKDFDMNGKKVGVGQLEVIDVSMLEAVKTDLEKAVHEAKAQGRHAVLLLLTDIMKEGSELICVSDDPELIKKTFGVEGTQQFMWLPGIMSRKKDVIPHLEAALR